MFKQKNIFTLALLTLSIALFSGCHLKNKNSQAWSKRHKKYVRAFDTQTQSTLTHTRVTIIAKNSYNDFKTTEPLVASRFMDDGKLTELPIQGKFWYEIRKHTYLKVEKRGYVPRILQLPEQLSPDHVFHVGLQPVTSEVK